MKRTDFKSRTTSTGDVVDIGDNLCAFIPAKLPPTFTCDPHALSLVDEAMLALGELRATIPYMPNPRLLTYPFARREAVLSSKIEGTHTELEQLYLFETEDAGVTEDESDAKEVHNYVVALEVGLARLRNNEIALCTRLLRDLHAQLFDGLGAGIVNHKLPGQYRRNQAYIGSRGIATARYVAPPAQAIDKLMNDLEKYVHSPAKYHQALVRIAIAHYQFEAIYPFVDGNGRIGRLLISLLLADWSILPEPLLYLSAHFERHVDEYRKRLWHVGSKGDWNGWIRFFLQGVVEVARDATLRAKRVIKLREEYRQMFQSRKGEVSILTLVDALFITPFITVTTAAKCMGITNQAARKNVNKLKDAGILIDYNPGAWRVIFVAQPILNTIRDSA